MGEAAVVFDKVWKKFRRGERHDSLRDLLPSLARRVLTRPPEDRLSDRNEFWALRDVSFEVRPGEALGIIGRNGAGKSTTLKLLNRIMKPTIGTSALRGRVGALIEVAAGFHPDLTGRENIYLQGAILGMKRAEIARRLDQIVEFAGISAFIDTPTKRYSSGMSARLGFAIAAHMDPQVLLIDEVLSVGDMPFQQKCIARMNAFKRNGVAIVFVSHHLPSVAMLCDRTAVMSGGRVRFIGATPSAIRDYLSEMGSDPGDGGQRILFRNVTLTDGSGQGISACAPGVRLTLKTDVVFTQDASDVTFWLKVHQDSGVYAYGVNSGSLGVAGMDGTAGDSVQIQFDFQANLARAQYIIELHAITEPTMTIHGHCRPAALLMIQEDVTAAGVANLDASCSVRRMARVDGAGVAD